ncbi:MAG: nucleotidyltransferase domain-containing protein [Promethearchaeota archaeon]
MVRVKVQQRGGSEVKYDTEHWEALHALHLRASQVTHVFHDQGFETLTYGSVARGDIHPGSDIDIVIKPLLSSYRLELLLEDARLRVLEKKIIQATPNDVIKANYILEDDICITLLLTSFTSMPFEFYHFGGALTHLESVEGIRKPGVDKRLMLILPTPEGHQEKPLEDVQYEAPKMLGISQTMVTQRIRVLTRRDKVGRTGVFLNHPVALEENIEETLRNLARKNRLLRRRLQR